MSWSLVGHVANLVILFYFMGAYVVTLRSNRLQREMIERLSLYLDYIVDRLARVEPVPITILDGLGRDISHLDDGVHTT